MGKLIFTELNAEKEVNDGNPIQPACEEVGVPFACKEGTCGTCHITVNEGEQNLSDKNDKEKDLLGDDVKERLACQCTMKGGDVKITF